MNINKFGKTHCKISCKQKERKIAGPFYPSFRFYLSFVCLSQFLAIRYYREPAFWQPRPVLWLLRLVAANGQRISLCFIWCESIILGLPCNPFHVLCSKPLIKYQLDQTELGLNFDLSRWFNKIKTLSSLQYSTVTRNISH